MTDAELLKWATDKAKSDMPWYRAIGEKVLRLLDEVVELRKEHPLPQVALGKLGGLKGGPARAAKLTPEQRRESAQKAARARWAKRLQGANA